MGTSRLDAIYRSLLITRFFTKGWGKPENLRRLFEFRKTVSNRDECFKLIERDYPVTITKEEVSGECRVVEGHFLTPLERFLPGIVPPVAQKAHFQALIPLSWPQPDFRPMCIHLAGTGDHYFWRRRQMMAKPLLRESHIGAIILENPFYGLRKPSDQVRSSLHNVSDIFVMGGCLILECLVLLHWCERNNLGPLGVTGLSMGGHMASLAATNWPKPLVLVPCLSWSTASAVFLEGVMSHSINWDLLEDQYLSDGAYREKLSKIVTVVDAPFLAGKKFAKKLSETVDTTINASILDENGQNSKNDVIKNFDVNSNRNDMNKNNTSIESKKIDVNNEEVTVNRGANIERREINLNSKEIKPHDKNESNKNNALDYTIKQIELNVALKETEIKNKNENETNFEEFKVELEKLAKRNVISQSLYTKLSSNERFELNVKDVDELNQLSKDILPSVERRVSESSCTKSSTEVKMSGTELLDSGPELPCLSRETPPPRDQPARSRNIAELTADILSGLPFLKTSSRKIDIGKLHWRDRETLQFMRGVMDEFTHLSNFTVPYDTSLIIAVCAKHDAYVPREEVSALEEIWPGAEVRYVDAGHVSAYLLHRGMFRACIAEAFERSRKKWKDGKHVL